MYGDKIYVESDKKYLAGVKTVIENSRVGNEIFDFFDDDFLDAFIVSPIIRRDFFGREEIIGYAESVTGEVVADRVGQTCLYRVVDHKEGYSVGFKSLIRSYFDGVINRDNWKEDWFKKGDLYWDIDLEHDVTEYASSEELEKYFSQKPEEVQKRLAAAREKAKSIVLNEYANQQSAKLQVLVK